MSLHNKGTDRLLTALGVKPEGTRTLRTVAELLRDGWNEGERPQVRGRDVVHIKKWYDAEYAEFEVWVVGRRIPYQVRGTDVLTVIPAPAPLAIIGPGGEYVREVRP